MGRITFAKLYLCVVIWSGKSTRSRKVDPDQNLIPRLQTRGRQVLGEVEIIFCSVEPFHKHIASEWDQAATHSHTKALAIYVFHLSRDLKKVQFLFLFLVSWTICFKMHIFFFKIV